MESINMLWKILELWPVFLTYLIIMSLVILYRFLAKKRGINEPKKHKVVKTAAKRSILTFQEFLWSLAVLGLLLNFISLEMDRLNTEKSIENYEVINRPYIYISKIDGVADAVNKILKCRVAIVNTGSVPGLNTTIEGSVTYGRRTKKSEDSVNYATLYPETVTWTRFGFPIDKERPVEIEYNINYSDYRGYKYEYVTYFYYNWEFECFRFEKSDETIIKP